MTSLLVLVSHAQEKTNFNPFMIYLTCVVWTCHTLENNFGMKHEFAKYLKESCR